MKALQPTTRARVYARLRECGKRIVFEVVRERTRIRR
jgi:hypothetical protein